MGLHGLMAARMIGFGKWGCEMQQYGPRIQSWGFGGGEGNDTTVFPVIANV